MQTYKVTKILRSFAFRTVRLYKLQQKLQNKFISFVQFNQKQLIPIAYVSGDYLYQFFFYASKCVALRNQAMFHSTWSVQDRSGQTRPGRINFKNRFRIKKQEYWFLSEVYTTIFKDFMIMQESRRSFCALRGEDFVALTRNHSCLRFCSNLPLK